MEARYFESLTFCLPLARETGAWGSGPSAEKRCFLSVQCLQCKKDSCCTPTVLTTLSILYWKLLSKSKLAPE